MKKNGVVVDRAHYRAGRAIARWVATGCNWAPGVAKESLQAQAKMILGQPLALAAIGRAIRGKQVTQSLAASLVRAMAGGQSAMAEESAYWDRMGEENPDCYHDGAEYAAVIRSL